MAAVAVRSFVSDGEAESVASAVAEPDCPLALADSVIDGVTDAVADASSLIEEDVVAVALTDEVCDGVATDADADSATDRVNAL